MRVTRRKFLAGIGVAALAAAGFFAASQLSRMATREPELTITQTTSHTIFETETVAFRVETFLENLKIPWSVAFAQDGRTFYTEREGWISVVAPGSKTPPFSRKFPWNVLEREVCWV